MSESPTLEPYYYVFQRKSASTLPMRGSLIRNSDWIFKGMLTVDYPPTAQELGKRFGEGDFAVFQEKPTIMNVEKYTSFREATADA